MLERNLDRQLGWVRASETRLSLILPLATALFASIALWTGQPDCSVGLSPLLPSQPSHLASAMGNFPAERSCCTNLKLAAAPIFRDTLILRLL